MKAIITRLVNNRIFVPVLLGTIVFVWITGGSILLPTKIDWLMEGDPATGFLAWHFFRNAPLKQSPFGANPNYGAEISNSLLFSDPIPLFAFLFKPFNALLPAVFQYFGIWIWLCFVLQAVFAWQLLTKFGGSRAAHICGMLFFLFAPAMLWRLHGHYSLCAHWVILAAYLLYFSSRHQPFSWIVLNLVTSLIQPYLLVMVLAIWLADLVKRRMLQEQNSFALLRHVSICAVLLLLVMWQVGYFMPGGGVSSQGFGYFRMNLLAIIDSDGKWSRLLNDVAGAKRDYEGFNYIGLGMIALGGLALVEVLRKRRTRIKWIALLPLFVISILFTLFAFSNRIAIGPHEILSFEIPSLVDFAANTFRSSGRFFWPVYYLVYLGIFFVIVTRFGRRFAARLLFFALTLQILDKHHALHEFRYKFRSPEPWVSPLQSSFWDEAANMYQRVVYVLPYVFPKDYLPLGYYAASNNMTINVAYKSRINDRKLMEARERIAASIRVGKYDHDTLYVFEDEELWQIALASLQTTDRAEIIDGFKILAPGFVLGSN